MNALFDVKNRRFQIRSTVGDPTVASGTWTISRHRDPVESDVEIEEMDASTEASKVALEWADKNALFWLKCLSTASPLKDVMFTDMGTVVAVYAEKAGVVTNSLTGAFSLNDRPDPIIRYGASFSDFHAIKRGVEVLETFAADCLVHDRWAKGEHDENDFEDDAENDFEDDAGADLDEYYNVNPTVDLMAVVGNQMKALYEATDGLEAAWAGYKRAKGYLGATWDFVQNLRSCGMLRYDDEAALESALSIPGRCLRKLIGPEHEGYWTGRIDSQEQAEYWAMGRYNDRFAE